MARRSKKRLAGLPSEHARRASEAAAVAETHFTDVKQALRNGNCRVAYRHLLQGVEGLARAEGEEVSSEGAARIPPRVFAMASDLSTDFGETCLRKPGLLDRFKRSRGR